MKISNNFFFLAKRSFLYVEAKSMWIFYMFEFSNIFVQSGIIRNSHCISMLPDNVCAKYPEIQILCVGNHNSFGDPNE